jgi:DNA replication protein
MSPFGGFENGKSQPIPIPAEFFTDVLPDIEDLSELKVTLYVLWHFEMQDDEVRYITLEEILADRSFSNRIGEKVASNNTEISKALTRAVQRGTFLEFKTETDTLFFLNSPRGRAAYEGLKSGSWKPGHDNRAQILLSRSRPNIFALYEQNIGLITPIMAETLMDAEKQYPVEWIEDALKIAVTRNARNWRFVEAILRSWKEKGRDEKDQRSSKEDRKRDSEGEFADYIHH